MKLRRKGNKEICFRQGSNLGPSVVWSDALPTQPTWLVMQTEFPGRFHFSNVFVTIIEVVFATIYMYREKNHHGKQSKIKSV